MQDVKENKKIEFNVYAEDLNGNPYTYTAQNLPDGATFDFVTQKLSWRPRYNQAGQYQILFISQDGSDEQTAILSVQNVTTRDWYRNFLSQNGKL
jgi:hypothetical protein